MKKIFNKRPRSIWVTPRVEVEQTGQKWGIWMEILLLYAGLAGYIFCNSTALHMGISAVALLLITALAFALMIAIVWYKRVFFGLLGGIAGLSLLAYKVSFPMYAYLWRAIEVCYNYTVYLLGSQENYSSYLNYMTMDLDGILENSVLLTRYFYTAIILLSLFAALFFALALFRRIPVIVSFLVPMAALVPFFFFGIVPHYIAFSVFLSALIGCYGQSVVQYMSSRKKRKAKGEKKKKIKEPLTTFKRLEFAASHGNFGVIIAGVMLAITIGTGAFIYTRPILQMDQVRETIDTLGNTALNFVFQSTFEKQLNVAGSMEDDDVLSMQVPVWRRLSVCTVYNRTDAPVYLRYRTMVNLTEDGWTLPDEDFYNDLDGTVDSDFYEYNQYYEYLKLTAPSGDPLSAGLDNIDSEEQGYLTDQVTVYPRYQTSDILGLPQGVTSQTPVSNYQEFTRKGDTLLYRADDPRDKSYSFRVVTPVLTSNLYLAAFNKTQDQYITLRDISGDNDPYMSRESAYSEFVFRHYLTLPDEVFQSVFGLAYQVSGPYTNKLEKVQAIERYFRDNYKYSAVRKRLSREDGTPANAYDYINYFLYQNEEKEGYCTLFASSMVAMVRALGYPARVATGYYADTNIVEATNYVALVEDSDFHSWVEVYFEGLGWLAFEPTPDFGEKPNYYLLKAIDAGEEIEEPAVEIEYIPPDNFVKYSNELPDPTIEKEDEDPLTDAIADMLQVKTLSSAAKWIIRIVFILLVLVGLFGLIELYHRFLLRRMLRLPTNAGVRYAYYLTLRLMQMQGFKFFEGEMLEEFARRADNLKLAPIALSSVMPIMQKARFSDLALTEEERNAVAEYVYALDKAAFRRANLFRAFWYRITLWWKPKYKAMIWKFK